MTVHVVEAEVCETGLCSIGHLLVRGDRVSFVSDEQVEKSGAKRKVNSEGRVIWDPEPPKSDVPLPRNYVVVHDTTGNLLSKCDLYIVRYYPKRTSDVDEISAEEIAAARRYYGRNVRVSVGSVELPEGPWKKIRGKMSMIRYRRVGVDGDNYEHVWEPSVDLYDCENPYAFRLPLPEGCLVDERGFVRP
jgi:hypothetical protein